MSKHRRNMIFIVPKRYIRRPGDNIRTMREKTKGLARVYLKVSRRDALKLIDEIKSKKFIEADGFLKDVKITIVDR